MTNYRLTKYNPAFRDQKGVYTKNEWTSFGDIGSTYDGAVFKEKDYLQIENNYLNAIEELLKLAQVNNLKLVQLENSKNFQFEIDLKVGESYQFSSVIKIAKQTLRENIWTEFKNETGEYLKFGYDYYVYLGLDYDYQQAKEVTEKYHLFLEKI